MKKIKEREDFKKNIEKYNKKNQWVFNISPEIVYTFFIMDDTWKYYNENWFYRIDNREFKIKEIPFELEWKYKWNILDIRIDIEKYYEDIAFEIKTPQNLNNNEKIIIKWKLLNEFYKLLSEMSNILISENK